MWKKSSKNLEASNSCRKVPTILGENRDSKLVSAVKSHTLTQLQGSNASHLILAQSVTQLWKRQCEQQSFSSRKHRHLLCLHISIGRMISAWFHSWDPTGVFCYSVLVRIDLLLNFPLKPWFWSKMQFLPTWSTLTQNNSGCTSGDVKTSLAFRVVQPELTVIQPVELEGWRLSCSSAILQTPHPNDCSKSKTYFSGSAESRRLL